MAREGQAVESLENISDHPPRLRQPLKRIPRIGRTGGRQQIRLSPVYRKNIFLIQLVRFGTVRIDGSDIRMGQYTRQVIRHHIPDTCIRRPRNLTACDHIPDRDVMWQQHIPLLFYALRHGTAKHLRTNLPEAVLLMSVEKLLFPRLHGRKASQY